MLIGLEGRARLAIRRRHPAPTVPSGLNLTIFSKDRACQLDLLLRSMKRHLAEWRLVGAAILYTSSDDAFEQGYGRLRELHPEFDYVRESVQRTFKEQTLALVRKDRPLTAFLVDDAVFIRDVSLDAREIRLLWSRRDVLCASLRLSPDITYSYALDAPIAPPRFEPGLRVWSWPAAGGDWGYPMSLDGHVFRTADIHWLLRRIEFANPNELEGGLARRPPPVHRAVCFSESKLVNIPANRVQDAVPNRTAGSDAADLNGVFLSGGRLLLEPLERLEPTSPHHELEYEWDTAQ